MILGILGIISMALNKILNGDLVIANMVKYSEVYLEELKDKQSSRSLEFAEGIEFYPKMIESLY